MMLPLWGGDSHHALRDVNSRMFSPPERPPTPPIGVPGRRLDHLFSCVCVLLLFGVGEDVADLLPVRQVAEWMPPAAEVLHVG